MLLKHCFIIIFMFVVKQLLKYKYCTKGYCAAISCKELQCRSIGVVFIWEKKVIYIKIIHIHELSTQLKKLNRTKTV